MESNGYGTYLGGWGMSIATQRAKERENRTPDVEVMAEMVKCTQLFLGGPCARGKNGPMGTGCPESFRGPVRTGSGVRGHGVFWDTRVWRISLRFGRQNEGSRGWGVRGGGMGGWDVEGTYWKGHAHRVCLARVHGVL